MTPSTPLIIVASSGALSELVGIVANPAAGTERYHIVAVVGQGPLLTDLAAWLEVPLVETIDEAAAESSNDAHVAVSGGGADRNRELAKELAARGRVSATLIHADTTIGPWVTIGPGSVISPGVRVTGNVILGHLCQLHTGAIVSHDDRLGDHVTLSPGVTLCGGVTVADGATVFAGATVMPGVSIGVDAVVGAGALVNRDVPDGVTVAGVPAKPLN